MQYRLTAVPRVELDVEGAFAWYENQRLGLGQELPTELRATYDRIVAGPHRYPVLRAEIRRALLKRFPYGVDFALQDGIVVVAVLHAGRDPAAWQRRS
ncbi:MAG: type II toxin-antitoxin system RelE/ParE family toxin [Pseudanabaenaceae cyanobacterium]